jgi:hypothetical protein
VASANPEDYTNRGRIITPLKDRFGAEIRTHYPTELDAEVAVIRQEAHLVAEVPDYLVEILARFTRNLRESSSVDQRSGVSARFSIAGAETVAAAALHRATVQGEDEAVRKSWVGSPTHDNESVVVGTDGTGRISWRPVPLLTSAAVSRTVVLRALIIGFLFPTKRKVKLTGNA